MFYYVNRHPQEGGEHEVHNVHCERKPLVEHRQLLGDFINCQEALKAAKKYYREVDGCYYCCPDCHRR